MKGQNRRKRYTKIEITRQQLDKEIQLFFEDQDYLSSITLAGASQHILGVLAENKVGFNSFKSAKKYSAQLHESIFGEEFDEDRMGSFINDYKNGLKHYKDGEPIIFDSKECAAMWIDFANSDYWQLLNKETDFMVEFKKWQHERGYKYERPLLHQ